MKYRSGKEFLKDPNKSILLMGLSGVGKTTLCRLMPSDDWFQYSVDYRVFTHYLGDSLNDYLKALAMRQPELRDLLKRDAITIKHRISFGNLFASTIFLGMLGNPEKGGRTQKDFQARMKEHTEAEISALMDIPKFKQRANSLYEYKNFLCDPTGSICEVIEIDDPNDPVMKLLEEHCTVVYIKSTDAHKNELLRRAESDPKPIYYRPDFLKKTIPGLLKKYKSKTIEEINPSDVGRYLYPKILEHRTPRYEYIADHIGYTVSLDDVQDVKKHKDLLRVIAEAIDSA